MLQWSEMLRPTATCSSWFCTHTIGATETMATAAVNNGEEGREGRWERGGGTGRREGRKLGDALVCCSNLVLFQWYHKKVQSRLLVWSTDVRSTRLYGQFLVGPEQNVLFVSVSVRLKVKKKPACKVKIIVKPLKSQIF